MDTCIRLVFHPIVKFSKCHVSRDSSRGSDLPKLSEQIKTRITKRCRRRLGLHIAKFPQPVSSTSGSLFISGCVSDISSEFGSPLESAIVICGYLICHLIWWLGVLPTAFRSVADCAPTGRTGNPHVEILSFL